MNRLLKSVQLIEKILVEGGSPVNEIFQQEEMTIGGRYFLVTGSASADIVDDSDYDRETGYGELHSPENIRCNIESVIEITGDGSEIEVSDAETISMIREHIIDGFH
jgi:hypothetical protein